MCGILPMELVEKGRCRGAAREINLEGLISVRVAPEAAFLTAVELWQRLGRSS